ncbi:MAG: DNA polymerase III subunit delta [Eubacteriales bacterium]
MANSVNKNVYLFHGQENFLREAAVKAAVNGVPLNIPELNYMVLDEKTPANDIIVACETLPVMDESRVILVKDSPCFSGDTSGAAKLSEYLPKIPISTVLIFELTYSADTRKKLVKAILNAGKVEHFKKLKGYETVSYLTKDPEINIDRDAAHLLVEYVGSDLLNVLGEIEKLRFIVGKNKIKVADIKKYVNYGVDYEVFLLHGYFMKKDMKNMKRLFDKILDEERSPFSIIGLIAAKFRTLHMVKSLLNLDCSAERIVSLTGLSQFEVKNALLDVKNFSSRDIKDAFTSLADLEVSQKKGEASFDLSTFETLCRIYKVF